MLLITLFFYELSQHPHHHGKCHRDTRSEYHIRWYIHGNISSCTSIWTRYRKTYLHSYPWRDSSIYTPRTRDTHCSRYHQDCNNWTHIWKYYQSLTYSSHTYNPLYISRGWDRATMAMAEALSKQGIRIIKSLIVIWEILLLSIKKIWSLINSLDSRTSKVYISHDLFHIIDIEISTRYRIEKCIFDIVIYCMKDLLLWFFHMWKLYSLRICLGKYSNRQLIELIHLGTDICWESLIPLRL